jgi:DNA-binding HxlR family transcriptional regulator
MRKKYYCPMDMTIDVIGGSWKLLIIWRLKDGTLRFGELKKIIGAISTKMLAQQLKELEADGLINRKAYLEVPSRVEYSLTDLGYTVLPLIDTLHQWGDMYIEKFAGVDCLMIKETYPSYHPGESSRRGRDRKVVCGSKQK